MSATSIRSAQSFATLTFTSCTGVAAVVLTPALLLAGAGGTDVPIINRDYTNKISGSGRETIVTAKDADLEIVNHLLDAGKTLEARNELARQVRVSDSVFTTAQRATLKTLVQRIDGVWDATGECSRTNQEAAVLVRQGDLAMAQRKAAAIAGRADATESDKRAAEGVLASITERQVQLAGQMPILLANATSQFDLGNYSAARAALSTIYRSGVVLSPEQRIVADTYQVKLLDLDRDSGRDLALAQPGTVRREQPADPAKRADEPLPQMTPVQRNDQPMAQPAPTPPPAPPAAPASPEMAPPAPAAPAGMEPAPMAPAAVPAMPKADSATDMMQLALKSDAQRTLAEADADFDAGRYAPAMRKYQAATTSQRQYLSSDEVARADRRFAEVKVRLQDNSGGTLSDDVLKTSTLIRERSSAEFASQMDEAERRLAAGDTNAARSLVAGADIVAKNSRAYYSQAEMDAFATRVTAANAKIAAREDSARESAARENEAKLNRETREAQLRLREEKDRKIYDSIVRVRELQKDRKYTEALQILDQVLYIDPNNPSAQLLHDVIVDLQQYEKYSKYKRLASQGIQQAEMDTHEALIPPLSIMAYPTNWPSKTFSRTEQMGMTETPENRRAMSALDGKKIPVQFKSIPLENALAYIAKTTATDVTPNWDSLESIGVDRNTRVNLSLINDVSAKVALEKVLANVRCDPGSRLDWALADGAVTVASSDTIRRQTTTLVYNVTDLLLETPNYKDVPELDLARVLAGKTDLDTRSSPFAKTTQRDERDHRQDRMRDITAMIEKVVDPESWRETGGETGSVSEINGTLVITQTPRNHAQIAGLLSKLREIRSLQINVEARFLLVSQDYFEQIGFNVNIYLNANSNQVRTAQVLDPNIRAGDFFDFSTVTGTRRVLASQNYAPSGSVTPNIGTPPTQSNALQNTPNANNFGPIGIGSNSLGLAQGLLPAAGFARDIISSAPALGIAGTFLDDIQVDFLVKATQADRRTVTLTAPRLTLTNGQTSNVYVVTQRAIITDLQPVVGDSAVGFDPTTGTVAEGVVMLVEAVVSSDRRYVTMNIDTSVNVIREIANQEITAVVGGALVNSATTGSFIQLPVVTTTRVQTTSTVPDEGTLLLGGQRVVTEIDIETGVPVLSKIPIINRFFTNRLNSKEESTLMVLVKPTVLIQTEEEEKNFPGLLDSARGGMGM